MELVPGNIVYKSFSLQIQVGNCWWSGSHLGRYLENRINGIQRVSRNSGVSFESSRGRTGQGEGREKKQTLIL